MLGGLRVGVARGHREVCIHAKANSCLGQSGDTDFEGGDGGEGEAVGVVPPVLHFVARCDDDRGRGCLAVLVF